MPNSNPALAQKIFQAQYAYSTGSTPSGLLDFGPITNGQPQLFFASGTPQATIDNVTQAAAAFDWTGATLPDPNNFIFDCLKDPNAPTFPTALTYCIAIYLALIQNATKAELDALLSAAQTAITAAYPQQAAAIITQIKTYLTNRNIPF